MKRWRRFRAHGDPEQIEGTPELPIEPERVPTRAEADEGGSVGTKERAEDRLGPKEVRMGRSDDSEVSVVSRGTRIEGTVAAAGSLRVDGEVRGKITAAGEVSLSPQGRVEANIEAESITLAGQVKGNLAAQGDVSLPADSRLDGNIEGQNVHVGGVVSGNVVGRGTVELGSRARVEGDIHSNRLAIAAGAVFMGRSMMGDDARKPE